MSSLRTVTAAAVATACRDRVRLLCSNFFELWSDDSMGLRTSLLIESLGSDARV